MSFTKKTWTDRISEFITRRLLTKADGSTEQVTVSRDEGEITQEGTPLNAESFNDLEGRIESAFSDTDDAISQLNTHLTESDKSIANNATAISQAMENITLLGTVTKNATATLSDSIYNYKFIFAYSQKYNNTTALMIPTALLYKNIAYWATNVAVELNNYYFSLTFTTETTALGDFGGVLEQINIYGIK